MLKRIKNKIIRICCSDILSIQKTDYEYLIEKYVNSAIPYFNNFDFSNLKAETISFIKKMQIDNSNEFLYSPSAEDACIYNTVYAILTYSLFSTPYWTKKEDLVEYLNQFQNEEGFFIDTRISSSIYWENADWWGKKHLLPHVLMAYAALGAKPKYQLKFLEKYYDLHYFQSFLESLSFDDKTGDNDNTIMNLGVALQYQRDFFNDVRATKTLDYLYDWLNSKINIVTGSWGNIDTSDRNELSRVQQVAYHLYILYLYDNKKIELSEKIIDLNLNLQSIFGAYNAGLLGSACTDIDVVFLFSKLIKSTSYRKEDIFFSIKKAFPWVLTNRNEDGGYVFRRNEPFEYGTPLMYSDKNESNLFATWFRSVCIAYMCEILDIKNEFSFLICPGYQY